MRDRITLRILLVEDDDDTRDSLCDSRLHGTAADRVTLGLPARAAHSTYRPRSGLTTGGGDRGRVASGRRTTTRLVKPVGDDVRLNREPWTLAERLAEAVS
jgi:hypothetical protein